MLILPSVFSSGALFLQNAPLTIHGTADAGESVEAKLSDHSGQITSAVRTTADDNGFFSLTLSAPSASLDAWTITISAGRDCHIMKDVLFGELWLASGQSNMELENEKQPDADTFLSLVSDMTIRVYHVYNIDGGSSAEFPYDPIDTAKGSWADCQNPGTLAKISAVGTAFSAELFGFLRALGRKTPVGFVNACWGGTGIRAWIPRTSADNTPSLLSRLKERKLYPDPETWNTHGRENAAQLGCQYNLKIHCLLGLKFRGILWYQGEYECWDEPYQRLYGDCLQLLYESYRTLFAADDIFPMLCVLIYPFPCTEGDCYIGYVNQNFIDAAKANPDAFHFMPIGDLPPIWNFPGDHPIHPLHKYPVGARLARLAECAVYRKEGQKNPAVLDRYTVDGNRLLLHFSVPGQPDALQTYGGIRIGEGQLLHPKKKLRPVGLYLCGASGTYVPAECEVLAPDTLALSHPGIAHPMHAAYGYNSMETECSLWAGEYPLGYFRTDVSSEALIEIECKPWCDPTRHAVWTYESTPLIDVFYRPIWKPTSGCEVVHDRAFTLQDGSIRIALSTLSDTLPFSSVIGATVDAHPYNRLDLEHYTALHLRMMSTSHASLSLVLTYKAEDTPIVLAAEKIRDLHHSWSEYRIPLNEIPAGEILRMEFRAEMNQAYYHFVNLEGFYLIPR